MDPLSISASIIGITAAAIQVSHLLKPFIDTNNDVSASARGMLREVTGIYVCLQQLQDYLLGKQEAARSRRSLILIEQVVIVFTDCVSAFSQLEQTLEGLKVGEHMRVIDKIKWAMKEAVISKTLLRLQASKASLNLMLTILSWYINISLARVMLLGYGLVQDVMRTNTNMPRRLENLEKMHPALARSRCTSPQVNRVIDNSLHRSDGESSRLRQFRFSFQDQLETSPVYQRVAANDMRVSKSSGSSYVLSCLSGLSLYDVSNVSALALPISPMELWNHHRYTNKNPGSDAIVSSLDAWYNPSAKRSAFIRTAYFNGQYTNQYAQSKFTGHLVYRRFTIAAPNSSPVFTEGVVMPQGAEELGNIDEVASPLEEYELEDTTVGNRDALKVDGRSQMRLESALDMPAPELSQCNETSEPFSISKSDSDEEPDALSAEYPPRDLRTQKPLPRPPSPVQKTRKALASTPCQEFRYSMLCEEEEAIFPRRKWAKPLADMGSAFKWSKEVLHGFEAIRY